MCDLLVLIYHQLQKTLPNFGARIGVVALCTGFYCNYHNRTLLVTILPLRKAMKQKVIGLTYKYFKEIMENVDFLLLQEH